MLPSISIKVDIKPREFLDRLEQIAKRSDFVRVERIINVTGYEGWESLNLEPLILCPHKKLCGAIIVNPDSGSRVFIEMIAKQWQPDPPTYGIYVEAARLLFTPLIKAYNREYNALCRLCIQRESIKVPVLPPETAKRVTSFIVCANKSALHPNDYKRFYQFIFFCHARHVKLSESYLKHLLVEGGFSVEKAEHLADIYYHGREILALRQ